MAQLTGAGVGAAEGKRCEGELHLRLCVRAGLGVEVLPMVSARGSVGSSSAHSVSLPSQQAEVESLGLR